jgi:radical SAM protein (TIGR01212 family)
MIADPWQSGAIRGRVSSVTSERINLWSHALRRQFGGRVQRVALDAGLSCPNIDGTRARGGCNFCDDSGSLAAYAAPRLPIREQLRRGIEHQRRRFKARRFVAYLQPHSNTHAPLGRLREIFAEALDHPDVVGLAIGTRPDCLSDEILDHLAELARERSVWLEIGLQSANDDTLRWMNRAHTVTEWEDAVARAKSRGLFVATHVILGCPTDAREDWLRSAELITRHRLDGLKFHMLCVSRRARLARQFEQRPFPLLTREAYASGVVDVLECIPASVQVMRLVSECSSDELVAPDWLRDKTATQRAIEQELERRGTWQGSHLPETPPTALSGAPPHVRSNAGMRI